MQDNEAIITKTDRGTTLVIMQKSDYSTEVNNFISFDNYVALPKDPTKEYNTSLNAQIEKSKNLLDCKLRRCIKPMKPSAPKFTGLPKILQQDIPIRPLVNLTTAPRFKTAKILY